MSAVAQARLATGERFIVASRRYSFKDHGRMGYGWSVHDTLRGRSMCSTDNREHADRIATALNGHPHEAGVYADNRRALFCCGCDELLALPSPTDNGVPA